MAAYPSFKPAFEGIVQSYNAAIDSATVLAYFIKHAFNIGVENTLAEPYVVKIKLADSLLREHYPGIGIDDGADFRQPGEYCPEKLFMFVLRLAKGYFPNTSFERVQDVYDLKKVLGESADDGLKSALVNDYKKVLLSLVKRYSNFLAGEIKLANAFWDAKFFSWFTISPNVSYQGYRLFGKGENGEVLKNESIAFWTPKVSLWFNKYLLFSDVAKLVRFGIEPILGNNLKDFKEVKYNERDTLQIESGGNVVQNQDCDAILSS